MACLPDASVQALHGDISQAQREKTLSRFRDGATRVLVATNVAARGLDVPAVDLVVHYELPRVSLLKHADRVFNMFSLGGLLLGLVHQQLQSRSKGQDASSCNVDLHGQGPQLEFLILHT